MTDLLTLSLQEYAAKLHDEASGFFWHINQRLADLQPPSTKVLFEAEEIQFEVAA